MSDRDVVIGFVAHLRELGHPSLEVTRWPEDDNRASPDIDCVAGPFAIEHTRILTIADQRRDSDWFMRGAGGVTQELSAEPPFRLKITVQYDAVANGQDWAAIREAFKRWITIEAADLPDGAHILSDVQDIPFPFHVTKASDRPPGVFLARWQPEDDTLPGRIRDQFQRKANKLRRYLHPGVTTVLLIESDDIALMNESKLLAAVREAFPSGPPPGIDRVWCADTSIRDKFEFKDLTADLS
jgi:hypothetical protein